MITVFPHLTVDHAMAAIEFYKKAFQATEVSRITTPDGRRLIHAELRIGETPVTLSDEFPEITAGCRSPRTLGGTTVTIHLQCPDVDKMVAEAIAAGAKLTQPVADMFWGDRSGRIEDPFGHTWAISPPQQKLTLEQIHKAAVSSFHQLQQQAQQ